ncbi:MAG: sulfatase-like hydrolase/transferase [Cyclobacteriaceae bacterium]
MRLFSVICAIMVSGLLEPALAQKEKQKPNIILFVTDDQSPIPLAEDHVDDSRAFGFNGENKVHTPIIDGLAKNGIIFNRAYVSSSVCSPSRYSTLTGRYAGRSEGTQFMKLHPMGAMTRVENNTELEMNRPNVARLLKKSGYKTGFVGKSHLIDHHILNNPQDWEKHGLMPYEKGAEVEKPSVSKAMAHNHRQWAERIKKYGFDYANGIYSANLRELYSTAADVHNVEWTTDAALKFIDKNSKDPFFLYYAQTTPHGPAPWLKKEGSFPHGLDADPKITGEGYVDKEYGFMPSRDSIQEEVSSMEGKDPDQAWLRWIDHAIGALVDKLKEKGVYENTLIIVTSDHGATRYGKTTLYETGVRVPLMMHWPNGIKPGSIYNDLVQNIDYAPTFLDLAGQKVTDEMEIDGKSLKPILDGNSQAVHDHLFFELGFARGVMTRDWKYIAVRYDDNTLDQIAQGHRFKSWGGITTMLPYYTRNSHLGYHACLTNPHYHEPNQLFDLKSDPDEKLNIYSPVAPKTMEMVDLLKAKLKTFDKRPFAELTE